MIFHDLFADGKSDACSFKFVLAVQALKNLEDLFGIALVKSKAVINKRDLCIFFVCIGNPRLFAIDYFGGNFNLGYIAGLLKLDGITQ